LSTHDDHRMAMSLSLLEFGGFRPELDNPGCVAKSFPEFWDRWAGVRP
ncbi:MAG: 3-phosphoshikimate 1-carboxyvinyltransferase, partial [Deltaproteobacteria bacterium]|nr:3-phosphoshikimate 1-carboxyvinyltransferase [Deltaproteobacteria bacterium]